ncbi:MAG: hypothetical protein COB85_02770 [Bacteroidetes bacterium]|nr:MAG: hypothetical protein COB85_02770 [Bacteroidota bacterium]
MRTRIITMTLAICLTGFSAFSQTNTTYVVSEEGETVESVTTKVYGSPDLSEYVAIFNHLDSFRKLTVGQELVFPPIDKVLAVIDSFIEGGGALSLLGINLNDKGEHWPIETQ